MATVECTWRSPHMVTTLATSRDGRVAVAGREDGHVQLYNCVAPPYEMLCESVEECEHITVLAVCASEDDLLVVTAHDQWMVRCWHVDVASRQIRLEWVGDGVRDGREKGEICRATAVCISHSREWVAVGGENESDWDHGEHDICLFSLRANDATRRPTRVFAGHGLSVHSLCFSPDDRFLVSAGWDQILCTWSMEDGKQLHYVRMIPGLYCMALWRCAEAMELVTGHHDGSIRLWTLDQRVCTSECVRRLDDVASVNKIYCAEDGKHVIAVGGNKYVCILNLAADGEPVTKLEDQTCLLTGVSVTSTGNVVSGSLDGSVRLLRLDDPDVRRAIAPVRTSLEKERAALQRARASSSSPLTTVVLTIIIIQNERRLRQIGQS